MVTYLSPEVVVGKCKERFVLQGKDIISGMTESEQCLHSSLAVLLSSMHHIMNLVIVKLLFIFFSIVLQVQAIIC